ncbi:MAG: hypothetical protein HYS12_00410 [Planctomycetes bacterium]|nr:hypothetical protein [Planctomycetota bacterium]
MRRRNQLRPDTFPFLAVLLCTMGSLILVLMILDRRARLAARDRAEEAWARAEKEEAEETARLRRQQETHRLARLEHHRFQVTRLTTQEKELRAEYERVRSRLEATLRSLHEGEQEEAGLAQRRFDTAKQLEQARQGLAGRKERLVQVERRSGEIRTERERLSADLLRLEESLTQLRQQRQREQRTWSVVPYVGRRGRNSRPFYLECTSSGLIFHPDHLTLDSSRVGMEPLVKEVKRRIDQRRQATPAGDPSAQPYWLLLVRPDGILHYYVALAALKALDVEYGYEFVDADWILDFPDSAIAPTGCQPPGRRPGPGPEPGG